MPTVFTVGNLRIVIYPNDHAPPHVHVVGPDGEAKVRIGGRRRHPSLISNNGLTARELARALVVIDENIEVLRQAWRQHHGT